MPHLAVFIIFVIFSAIKWSIFFHLVFRWRRDSNRHPRTMSRIVSHWHSPLDQVASLKAVLLYFIYICILCYLPYLPQYQSAPHWDKHMPIQKISMNLKWRHMFRLSFLMQFVFAYVYMIEYMALCWEVFFSQYRRSWYGEITKYFILLNIFL